MEIGTEMNEKSGFAAKRQPTHRHGGPGGALGRPVEKAKDFRYNP